MERVAWECRDCVRWRKSCRGVYRDPDWDGRQGGCGRIVTREQGQTTLEAWE